MIKKILYIILLLSGLTAKSAVVVDTQTNWLDISSQHDKTYIGQNYSLDQFLKCKSCNNQPITSITKGKTGWFHFTIINSEPTPQSFVINTGLHIEDLTFFWNQGQEWDSITIGHLHPMSTRKIKSRHLVAHHSIGAYDTLELVVRYRAISKPAHIYLFLQQDQEFFNSEISEYVFLSLFYGILIYLLFHSVLYAFLDRTKLQLRYALYVTSVLFYLSFRDGLAFQYLWPNSPPINLYHAPLAFYLLLISTSWYASYYIDSKAKPWLHRLKNMLLALVTLHISLFLLAIKIPLDLSLLYYAAYLILYYQLFSLFWKERKAQQLLFIIGYSFMLIGWAIFKLQELELIGWSYFVEYYIYGALLLEAILFAISLAKKSKELIVENSKKQQQLIKELKTNEELKTKINRELESLVNQRTSELKESNSKLEQLSSEVDKINWKLQKQVLSEKMERIENRSFTYSEFLKVFLNSFACQQYLAQLKLDLNSCEQKSCSIDVSSTENKKVEIRCESCKLKESATQNTLFHALKFDITKALYLTYVEFHSRPMTNEQLATEIDLRTATVWNFRKKVRVRMDQYQNISWKELLVLKS